LDERLHSLNEYFTYSLYENVCRSLFETHKLLFSFILTHKILQGDGVMDPIEWRYLLAGPSGEVHSPKNPTTWLSDNAWPDTFKQFSGLSKLDAFKGID